MSHIKIAPSILASDFGRLAEEVRTVAEAGADWIHVDVMDGHFVPNLTIGPPVLPAVKAATDLPLDVHLMIEAPERSIADYANGGADRIGVHFETCPHLHSTIQQIHALGKLACVVLNPGTPAEAIEPVMGDLDQVLVMSVNPGFGGQAFIESVLPKCERIRSWIEASGRDIDLEIDGGITTETIGRAHSAGVNVFVAGTAVFGKRKEGEPPPGLPEYRTAIQNLRDAAGR
jgi:ribulose-phosphate 3-epimerase